MVEEDCEELVGRGMYMNETSCNVTNSLRRQQDEQEEETKCRVRQDVKLQCTGGMCAERALTGRSGTYSVRCTRDKKSWDRYEQSMYRRRWREGYGECRTSEDGTTGRGVAGGLNFNWKGRMTELESNTIAWGEVRKKKGRLRTRQEVGWVGEGLGQGRELEGRGLER